MTRNGATAWFKIQLADLVGYDEYAPFLRTTQYRNGNAFRVYEFLRFDFVQNRHLFWLVTKTVATIIADHVGATATSTLINAICKVFNVAVNASSFIGPSSMNEYICDALFVRYVTANGSEYAYNVTDKLVRYMGYENPSASNTDIPQIDTGSQLTVYSDSSTYYYSYNMQVDDAYANFLVIGQQP